MLAPIVDSHVMPLELIDGPKDFGAEVAGEVDMAEMVLPLLASLKRDVTAEAGPSLSGRHDMIAEIFLVDKRELVLLAEKVAAAARRVLQRSFVAGKADGMVDDIVLDEDNFGFHHVGESGSAGREKLAGKKSMC